MNVKRFHGIYPFTYSTLFGLVRVVETFNVHLNERCYVLQLISRTSVECPVAVVNDSQVLAFRHFSTKLKALRFLQSIEKYSLDKIKELFGECITDHKVLPNKLSDEDIIKAQESAPEFSDGYPYYNYEPVSKVQILAVYSAIYNRY